MMVICPFGRSASAAGPDGMKIGMVGKRATEWSGTDWQGVYGNVSIRLREKVCSLTPADGIFTSKKKQLLERLQNGRGVVRFPSRIELPASRCPLGAMSILG